MASTLKDFGAVAVDGDIKYELLEHDATHLELRNVTQTDQHIVIDVVALPGLASIIKKAAKEFGIS
jgi:hypothetical protein